MPHSRYLRKAWRAKGFGVWWSPWPSNWPALARAGQLKSDLEMLGNGLVQQRAFGVAGVVELGFGCCCWLGCSKRSVARWVVRMGSAAAWQRVLHTTRALPVGKGLIRWAIDVDPLAI